MDGEPANAIGGALDLAGVDACVGPDPERAGIRTDSRGRPDRARGTVERRKQAIACPVDLDALVGGQVSLDAGVEAVQKVAPCGVTQRCGRRGGVADVDEEQSRQCPVGEDRGRQTR